MENMLVEWKDNSFYWVPLKNLKQSNPVDLSEYAVANGISDEPAFNWWFKNIFQHSYTIGLRIFFNTVIRLFPR